MIFLSTQASSIRTMDYGRQDPTIRLLYAIDHEHATCLTGAEDENVQGIKNICEVTTSQLEKVSRCLAKGDAQSLCRAKVMSKMALIAPVAEKEVYRAARDNSVAGSSASGIRQQKAPRQREC
ncbi:hypothetical protein BCR43DRAFT_485621 [Syncephalastrum racemosum]|uniref:Uncharacterized protein n=1 Tax=Syncephalastrum racemosum TaxID=13706 RepID=A0A1X2HP72_SYNRA|nr:hypothetical protein BCR43DRAFT_485621 [Syncephalastrum racemosum]